MRNTSNFSGPSLVHFSRWSRKSYAVFNSLNKLIKIGRLKVSISILTLATGVVFAQDQLNMHPQPDQIELDELEVTAQAEPLVFSQHGRSITTITQKEIESAPVNNLASLLSFVQSVDIRQRGAQGVQSDLSLRGGSFDQVLVLLNGIPISDPQTGHFNLNLPIHLDDILRIEVLRGPGARIFGPNAFSGAINIITKSAKNNGLSARLTGGQNAYYEYGISGHLALNNWKTMISYNQSASDGYMENTDFKSYQGYLSSSLQLKKILIDAQLGLIQKSFGANSFYSPKYPMQYESNQTYLASFGLHFGKKVSVSIFPFYRQNRDHWQLTREKPDLYQNFHQTDVYGLRGKSIFYSVIGKSTLGINLKQESLLSSSMGEKLDEPINIPWSEHQFKYSYHRSHASLYLEQSKHFLDKWQVSLGLLAHWYQAEYNHFKVYPGIDISYQLNDKLRFYASANQAMRLPTFTDLFYSGPANKGNKNLLPEKSLTFEAGAQFTRDKYQFGASLFQRQGKDIIDWVWFDSIWQTQNFTELTTNGIELSVQTSPHLWTPLKFWKNLEVDYTYLDMVKGKSDVQSKYALNHLRHQLNIKILFELINNLELTVNGSYKERFGSYQTYNFEDENYEDHPYEDYFLVNARVSYLFRNFQFYVEAQNLSDVQIIEFGVHQPGLWLMAGCKFQWGK